MAPIKFEEDMKDKLEKRTIQPSAKSWATLSQRLDKEEKKSNKKGFWWLGIAASIIGVLLVTNAFLNIESKNNTNTIIVEENTTNDTLKIEVPKQIFSTPKQEVIVKTKKPIIKKPLKKADPKSIERTKYYANNTSTNSKNKTKIIVNKAENKALILVDKNNIENETVVFNTENKPDKTNNTEIKNYTVTDNEINALLARATEDIAMQKTKDATIPIDYNGLLTDVEDDLDETFRDKMFKAVKKRYETVRESVAERND